jgi:hypothetical protein
VNEGVKLRDEALDAVHRAAPEVWRRKAVTVVKRCALLFDEFTTDDVWEALEWAPPEPRALGAVMMRARLRGWCEPTDRTVQSYRRECHARPIRVWRSLLRRKGERVEGS